ncbi:RNA polymerase sigma factor [Parabacteroides sp. AM08-6]|uniref:RNA polymerase sigma factor n=1 Tax=Parabacteroides sp. AM08-6 TaxID=2292053 RepID=UPI000F00F733|nr:RNA polymerase sigma-70 factor [Parabacteroides sp. AM08-6]RHJ86590.1 RNA polymerase sigma-70 factor [Parabacteroides sp. AM08-6]
MQNEKDYIIELREGNQQAFSAIYDSYHIRMYSFAYKYLQNKALAEDAVQAVFLYIWERRAILNPDFSFKSFIFTLLKNHLLNMIRDRFSHMEKDLIYLSKQPSFENPENLSDFDELVRALYTEIEALPARKRAICKLKIGEGLDNKEIASQLNISINTVKFQYSQSIKMLRDKLEKYSFLLLFLLK